MTTRITRVVSRDVRFPTSRTMAGSDAVNRDPDYSAAYVVLGTDHPAGAAGHGLAFTIGRGTEVVVAAIDALAPHLHGLTIQEIAADMAGLWRTLVTDSQVRWLGPEKGVVHLATAALVNAVWDLYAKLEGKPLWKLLADMTPEQLVACVDFRYIEDALKPAEALDILRRRLPGRREREAEMRRDGFPAYTTSAGWMGYSEASLAGRARAALDEGFSHLKLKVGLDLEEAIAAMEVLGEVRPWWIEEPTSPDDVLGHRRIREAVRPAGVATGEHVQNRVVFKQLFQAGAIDFCQVDACRLGGVNELLAVLLMAAKFEVPVCPHAGGVGLCEYVQHLSIFDYVAVGASLEGRVCEYVDHLHEHFVDPCRVVNAFPDGPVWRKGQTSGAVALDRMRLDGQWSGGEE